MRKKHWEFEWLFVPNDLWVGVYIKAEELPPPVCWHFYICLLPCLPLHIYQTNA